MNRREFIGLSGSVTAIWPIFARAQAVPVIGYLTSRGSADDARMVTAFRDGLQAGGFVEGQNVTVEYRFANNQYDRLAALVADLVRHHATVLVTGGAPSAPAAAKVATSLPIVFVTGGDPVAAGLVASLNRPGGNLTGINVLNTELTAKRLELLRELVPAAAVIALLVNPRNPNAGEQVKELRTAVRAGGPRLEVLHASTEAELNSAFAAAAELRAGGLVIGSDAFFNGRSDRLAALALKLAMPAIFSLHAFVTAGGLMSYGASIPDAFRLAGIYASRIVKGEKPADLPVQQSSKIELAINLKTAKRFGLAIPPLLLARADEVIE